MPSKLFNLHEKNPTSTFLLDCYFVRANLTKLSLFHNITYVRINVADVQCPPLNRIILGKHKSDNNNQFQLVVELFTVKMTLDQQILIKLSGR